MSSTAANSSSGPAAPAGAPGTRPTGAAKYLALTAMVFAVGMTFIDQTIVSIAAPQVQEQLALTRGGVQWVVNAYLLALAATFALGGRLTDVLGSKRMALIGVTGFAVTSALCGFTPKGALAQTWIVVFRTLQGVSAAFLFPAALAVVVAAFPLRERGKALAIFFGISGGLTAIGPIAGGYLTQWTWRAIFWINIPVAVIAVVLTLLAHIPLVSRRERIDWRGAALAALGMALSVFGFEQVGSWGWSNPGTWAVIVGGLAVLVIFVLVERRTVEPLIKMAIFSDRAFKVDNGVLFFSMMAFVPVFFFASVYSQVLLGYGAAEAGIYLLVFFAGFAPAAQIGGRILDARGAKPAIVAGTGLATAGFLLWALRLPQLSLGAQWWAIVMSGAGIGLLLGPASTDAVNRAINASYGEVTGITQTIRNYGSALGLAVLGTVLGTVFSSRLVGTLTGAGVPRAQAEAIAASASDLGGAGGTAGGSGGGSGGAQIQAGVAADFAVATQYVMVGMAIALALSFLIALLHPGGHATEGSIPAGGG